MDTTIRIVTPENISFSYRLAGPFRRMPAFLIDLLIRVAIIVAIVIAAFTLLQGAGTAVLLIGYFIIDWGYGGLFETYMNGQTPGKRLLGIRVVTTDGLPIDGSQAMIRNVLRAVDLFPVPFLTSAIAMLLTSRFQRIGDLAADTMVVVEEDHRIRPMTLEEGYSVERLQQFIPASYEGDSELAQALSSYVGRRRTLSPARRREVANYLADPICRRFRLPAETDPDMLLCALYKRIHL